MRTMKIAAVTALMLSPGIARAHPHIWVTVSSEIVFGPNHTVEAIRHHWTFDEAYSSFIVLGLDKQHDGNIMPQNLQDTSIINIKAFKESKFFTFAYYDGHELPLTSDNDFKMEYIGKRFGLKFTLNLTEPLAPDHDLLVRIYDPSYFVSLTLSGAADAVHGIDQPKECSISLTRPESADDAKRVIPDAIFLNMEGNKTYGEKFANEARVTCH